MTFSISAAHNDYRLQATISFVALGSGTAKLQIYSGTRPANGGAVTAGNTLLAEVPLPSPFGAVTSHVLVLTASSEVLVAASGTAAWARLLNANGDYALDGDVSDTKGNGDFKLASVSLYQGGYTRLASGALV